MLEITFITGNAKKAEELGRHLNHPVAHQKLDVKEIQSLDLSEIIEEKALEAYKQIQKPVLVEDTSLTFSALGSLPGPLIKWFLQELGNDRLCKLVDGYGSRDAIAEVQFGLCLDGTNVLTFSGQREGVIAPVPRGEQGFGWDPIFIPKGYDKTWGEMNWEEKDATSMRMIALNKLEEYLKQ